MSATYHKGLSYKDILISPQFSDIMHRNAGHICLKTVLHPNLTLDIPLISANMDTVTETEMAIAMAECGGLGVIHRYLQIEEQARQVEAVKSHGLKVGASIGVKRESVQRAYALIEAGVDCLVLDVAHGHHENVRRMIAELKGFVNFDEICVMAGNVATKSGASFLQRIGVSSIKVGIGGGCFSKGTLVRTEHGYKPIESVEVGDVVTTHTGEKKPVTNTFTHQNKNSFVVINDIEATPNHEFYVLHKKYRDIVTDDNLSQYAEWIPAEDLDKSYLLLQAKMLSKFNIVEIQSIETTENPSGIAYDLEVAENHSYTVSKEDIVVHNSKCKTRGVTGCGVPQVTALRDTASVLDEEVSLVADGAITESGDIIKALVLGANAVMIGGLFAGTDEAPGLVHETPQGNFKTYRGMASLEAFHQRPDQENAGKTYTPEGVSNMVRCKGSVKKEIQKLIGGVYSGMSYLGCQNIQEVHTSHFHIWETTHAGQIESNTRE
jgi:IMP dehydrogenase